MTFTGYELYYKCYNTTDSSVNSDQIYGSPSYSVNDLLQHGFLRVNRGPGSGGGLAVDTTPGTGNAPLVDLGRIDPSNTGSTYTIKITVNNSTSVPNYGFATTFSAGTYTPPVTYFEYFPAATPTTSTAGWEIRRPFQADSSLGQVLKTFASNTFYPGLSNPNWSQVSDTDISSIYGAIQSSGLIYVQLYAVSYGTAIDGTFRASYPAWLGYTLVQIIN